MEGNKSAMYEQAGRNRGWTRGANATASERQETVRVRRVKTEIPAAPAAAVPVGVPVAQETATPVMQAVPVIPAPPVVTMPGVGASTETCQTLAMAYIAAQEWRELYEPEQGLSRGTIFAELDLPFVGEGACRRE